MSIIIKDMKMPKCCDECPLFDTTIDGICSITHSNYEASFLPFRRMPNCPLIEVPINGEEK